MKNIEILKAQKVLNKILNDSFDENDVDNLYMRLRNYSQGFHVFREIADFIGHNNDRDRGIINNALESMHLRMKYYSEYNFSYNPLVISKPFPYWIKTLMIYQIDKCKEESLLLKYNIKKKELKKLIDQNFIKIRETDNVIIKESANTFIFNDIINYILGFISIKPPITQSIIIEETINLLQLQKFDFEKEQFQAISDNFILCTLLLLHNVTFSLNNKPLGIIYIDTGKNDLIIDNFEKTNIEHVLLTPSLFGNLKIMGKTELLNQGKKNYFCYPILTTNLDVIKYCDTSLFIPYSNFDRKVRFRVSIGDRLTIINNKLSNF